MTATAPGLSSFLSAVAVYSSSGLFVLFGCGTVTVSPSTHQTPAGVELHQPHQARLP